MKYEFINYSKLYGRAMRMQSGELVPFAMLQITAATSEKKEPLIFACAVDDKQKKIYVDGEVIT